MLKRIFKRKKLNETEKLAKRFLVVAVEACRAGYLDAGVEVARAAKNVLDQEK